MAIIGAAGFLGTALSRTLHEAGCEVHGYGRSVDRPDHLPAGMHWHRCDVLTDAVHLPAETVAVFYLPQSPHYRDFAAHADHVLGVNTVGAMHAAKSARKSGVRCFCYASTGNVYAPSFQPLAENSPLRWDNGYALSKVSAEAGLKLVAGEMAVCSVRIFGLFGPGQTGMLVPKIHDRVVRREAITLQPAEEAERPTGGLRVSLCFVDDAARILFQLNSRCIGGDDVPPVLNLAGPEPISLRRLAEEIGAAISVSPVFETAANRRAFDLHADVSRLQNLLQPQFTPFSEAIARTFSAEKPQPASPYRVAG